jgi:hypothetical protein
MSLEMSLYKTISTTFLTSATNTLDKLTLTLYLHHSINNWNLTSITATAGTCSLTVLQDCAYFTLLVYIFVLHGSYCSITRCAITWRTETSTQRELMCSFVNIVPRDSTKLWKTYSARLNTKLSFKMFPTLKIRNYLLCLIIILLTSYYSFINIVLYPKTGLSK